MPSGRKLRWLRNLGLILMGLMIVLAALLIWLASDTERAHRAIESIVSETSGRSFTIEGGFDFELGRQITVRAEKIRWRNAASNTSPYMLEIETFTGSLDLFSLFDGPAVVNEARVDHAVLRFEWDDDGAFNWNLGTTDEPVAKKQQLPDPLPLLIDKAGLRNISVHFRHPALTEELEVVVSDGRLQRDAEEQIVVSAMAVLEGRELSVDGRIGPFPELAVAGAVDFDVLIKGELAEFSAIGKSAWLRKLRDLKLKTRLTASSAVDLAQHLKLPLKTHGDVQIDADTSNSGEAVTAAVNGWFGEYRVAANLRSNNSAVLPGVNVALESSGPSIRDLAKIAGIPNLPDAPYKFDISARQTEQGVDLQAFGLDTSGLQVNGSGTVRTAHGIRDMNLQFTAAGSDFTPIAQLFDQSIQAELPFDLDATIVGNGTGQSDTLNTRLRLGSTVANLVGSISEADGFSGSRLQFSIDAPDAKQLEGISGLAVRSGTRLKLQGVSILDEDRITIENLQASLDDAELTGKAWIGRISTTSGLHFEGSIKGPNLAHIGYSLLPPAMKPKLPKQPFEAELKLHLASDTLDIGSTSARIGTGELAFSGQADLKQPGINFAGDLSAQGYSLAELLNKPNIRYLPDTAFKLNTGLVISPADVRLTKLSYTGKQVSFDGELSFTGERYERINFDLIGHGNDLSRLLPEFAAYHPPEVPFDALAQGTSDLKQMTLERLHVRAGDAHLEISGELQLVPAVVVKGMSLKATGQRLTELGEIESWKLKGGPFNITASFKGGARQQVIENLRFESGKSNLSGRVSYDLNTSVPSLGIELQSTYLDLDEIRGPQLPKVGVEKHVKTEARMFSNQPLPFHVFDTFNAEIDVDIDHLITHQRVWRNLIADASLKQGVLKVRRAQVDAAEGKLNVTGMLQPTPTGRVMSAEIMATHAMIALQDMTAGELQQLPHHAIAATLSASGNTPHELASSLDGFAWIVGGQGQVRRSKLGVLAGDFFTEIVAVISPGAAKKKKYAQVECQAAYLEIINGIIKTAPALVAHTEYAITLATGTINLATEKINLIVETTPRKGIGVGLGDYATPFFKIGGTLNSPEIVLDPKGTLIEGGAALATYGLSVIVKGVWERLVRTSKICEKVGGKAVKLRRKRNPQAVPDMQQLIKGTQKFAG